MNENEARQADADITGNQSSWKRDVQIPIIPK